MNKTISLPGLRAESLLGFLAALGTARVLQRDIPQVKLFWQPQGGGWEAVLELPADVSDSNAEQIADKVFASLDKLSKPHWVLDWERFLGKSFASEHEYFRESAIAWLDHQTADETSSVFCSQIEEQSGAGDKTKEHFDNPFRAARKDYYPGNLKSVIQNTKRSHLVRAIAKPWDYMDAMANQSLRLDHLDDRRHAYQWHAPTEDPARQKSGCMLGANRLAIEAFPLFPCVPGKHGNSAIAFKCSSKTYTWITWPVWSKPCSIQVISSLLNMQLLTPDGNARADLSLIGISSVFQSRRVPVEKNKIFLPPTLK